MLNAIQDQAEAQAAQRLGGQPPALAGDNGQADQRRVRQNLNSVLDVHAAESSLKPSVAAFSSSQQFQSSAGTPAFQAAPSAEQLLEKDNDDVDMTEAVNIPEQEPAFKKLQSASLGTGARNAGAPDAVE